MASVAHVIAVGIDRKIADEQRRRQQEWLSVTLSSIGDAVIATDANGNVTFLNGVAQQLTGWGQDEAQGQPLANVFNILHEQTREPVDSPVTKVLETGHIVGLGNHTILVARDGRVCPIDDCAAPIRDLQGNTIGVVLIFRDVTEQRRSENEVRQSEARKAAILETALDCIITIDHHGSVVDFNPAAERTFGYRREQIVGQPLAEFLIPLALREQHWRGLSQYLATGEGPILGKRLELSALRSMALKFQSSSQLLASARKARPFSPPTFVTRVSENAWNRIAMCEPPSRRHLARPMASNRALPACCGRSAKTLVGMWVSFGPSMRAVQL